MDVGEGKAPLVQADVARLQNEVKALQQENSLMRETLSNHANGSSWRHPAQLLQFIANLLALGLIFVTWRLSRDSLNAAAEEKLRPIVVLGVDQDRTELVIKNIGFGPALNGRDIELKPSLSIFHVAGLEPNGSNIVRVFDTGTRQEIKATEKKQRNELIVERLKADFLRAVQICIAYTNARVEWYETRQTISFSTDPNLTGFSGLIIDFNAHKKTGDVAATCPEHPRE